MTKNLASDEIDLLNVIFVVWKKKFQVVLFVILALVITLVYQLSQPPKKIRATTEIRPISVYDEAKYEIYNSIMKTIRPYYISKREIKNVNNNEQKEKFASVNSDLIEIRKIDKDFLNDMFIDRLNQQSNLITGIKKFGLIERENYSSKTEFEEAVSSLASSIELIEKKNKYLIKVKSYNLENWEDFLAHLEKESNLEIQKKLSEMFENYISYGQAILKFEIEDIDTQISVTTDENEILELEKKKDIINANKYFKRMQDLFDSSPISDSKNFYAAKIIYNSTEYYENNNNSIKSSLLISAIFGALFGIFFVLIANAIAKRK